MHDFLKCHPAYSYFSNLDVLIQYFTFELGTESQGLCLLSISFAPHIYKCVLMGIK